VCIAELKNSEQMNISAHLEVRKPSLVVSYLDWCFRRWRLDHLLPKLPKYIKDLVEIALYSLCRSPKYVVHNSEPMVKADNMKKHSNLLFHTGVDVIQQQSSLPKPLDWFIEWGSSHPMHLNSLYIIRVVDVVQIGNPLLISG
jgi:hypothetical protein